MNLKIIKLASPVLFTWQLYLCGAATPDQLGPLCECLRETERKKIGVCVCVCVCKREGGGCECVYMGEKQKVQSKSEG